MDIIHNGALYWINVTPTYFSGQVTTIGGGVSYATVAICV
jgi:hypothetical protein